MVRGGNIYGQDLSALTRCTSTISLVTEITVNHPHYFHHAQQSEQNTNKTDVRVAKFWHKELHWASDLLVHNKMCDDCNY